MLALRWKIGVVKESLAKYMAEIKYLGTKKPRLASGVVSWMIGMSQKIRHRGMARRPTVGTGAGGTGGGGAALTGLVPIAIACDAP